MEALENSISASSGSSSSTSVQNSPLAGITQRPVAVLEASAAIVGAGPAAASPAFLACRSPTTYNLADGK